MTGNTSLTVGGQIQRSARTPFLVASEIVLEISTDVNDRHIYPLYGAKSPSGDSLFGLGRAALDDIKDAAGIMILESRPAPDVPIEPYCVTWQVRGRRDHIDGFVQEEVATYRLDLDLPRVFNPAQEYQDTGGGRYAELYAGYYESALEAERKARKMKWEGQEKKILQYEQIEQELGEEWVHAQRTVAHRRAVREVMRMRPHITRRAETGAIHALIRNMLGVKHAYTIPELKQGIKIIRAQQNREALDLLPPEIRTQILTAQAIEAFGLDPATVAALQRPKEVPALAGGVDEEDMELDPDTIEGVIVATEPEPDELPVEEPAELEEEPEKGDGDTGVQGDTGVSQPKLDVLAVVDELSGRLAELAGAGSGDDTDVSENMDRFQVQTTFGILGMKNPKWPMTVGQISAALNKRLAEMEKESKDGKDN